MTRKYSARKSNDCPAQPLCHQAAKTPFLGKVMRFLVVLLCSSYSLQAQQDTIVIIFTPAATPSDIANTMAALNARQLGMTFPSEARLWEVECTPGMPCYYNGDEYIDVNEVIKKVSNETKTESIGKNYTTQLPVYTNFPVQDPGPFTEQELTNCSYAPVATGKGTANEEIIIALIDSGVDKNHSFFKYANYFSLSSRSFIGANCFNDHKGHGTHIAGIIRIMDILGGSANSFKIMNLQTQKPDGSGKVWDAIRAVDWANTHGADIINMSLGYLHDPLVDSIVGMQPLQVAIEKANWMNDVLVVASAGNDALDIDTAKHYPSAFSSANLISVASDSCSTYFSNWFSNYGVMNVDLAAPGEEILGPNLFGSSPKWTRKTGTSMAAGIVTGAAGLLATHLASTGDGPLKCAILAGADFKGYPVLTDGTLHTPQAKDSLLTGGCLYVPMLEGPETPAAEWAAEANQERALSSFPQPFDDQVKVRFSAGENGPVQWYVFDAFGRLVEEGEMTATAGNNVIVWNGGHVPAGLYWLNLHLDGEHMVRKMIKQ